MADDWLKFKKYPHIGIPLTSNKDRYWVKDYVRNPSKVASHKFLPLIRRVVKQRKYRPVQGAPINKAKKRQRSVLDPKEREIHYASHMDSILYSYYSHVITQLYESFLEGKPYSEVAVAYRKIPLRNGKSGNKSNIEFAYEAFKFIEENKNRKLSVIVSDITSFFDNLDHHILHHQWKRILGATELPPDHYAIYKSLINFKYVNEKELFKHFKDKLIAERHKPNDPSSTIYRNKKVSKIRNMRHERVVAFCTKDDFLNEAINLIRHNKPNNQKARELKGKEKKKGIPQGTPVSATLANVYMLEFDEIMHAEATANDKSAYYQRYSDDLIIICDQADEKYFIQLIQDQVENKAKLEIQPRKTNIYRYSWDGQDLTEGGILKDGNISAKKQLEYLGFEYDGKKVRVKTAGFSKFYRNMKKAFRRGGHYAKAKHIPSELLFETRLYKRFTHHGSKRRLKWLPDDSSPSGYSPSKHFDWGNFISYLIKANDVMKEINGDDSIKRQSRHLWKNFHKIKKLTKSEIAKSKYTPN